MKKIFLTIFLSLVVVSSLASPVFAQEERYPRSFDDILALLEKAAVWLYRLFFVIAVFYVLWAAYLFLSAKDDTNQVSKAKKMLINAAIAVAVALISTGFSQIVSSFINTSSQ